MRSVFTAIALLLVARVGAEIIPAERRIDWAGGIGIPGGIPTYSDVFQTIAQDTMTSAQIQTVLNNAGAAASSSTPKVVLLSGTLYTNSGRWLIPSYVVLRGAGMFQTVIKTTGSGVSSAFRFGGSTSYGELSTTTGTINISSGYTKGSSNIVIASSGPAVGDLMTIDQLNESGLVELYGTYGTIDYGTRQSAARAMGQTVEVKGVTGGTTINFWPPLYHTLTAGNDPEIVYWTPPTKFSGVENMTIRSQNTGVDAVFEGQGSAYCWVKDVELDHIDRDQARFWSCLGMEMRENYFHDSYVHTSGQFDNPIMLAIKTSGCLIEDNIILRMHIAVMLNWGASGNVIGYNYTDFEFDSGSQNVMMYGLNGNHGSHPSYNLSEGNITPQLRDDSAWGSSSHHTAFRNWLRGYVKIFPPYTGGGVWDSNNWHYATQGLRAFDLDFQQRTNNLVGNIIGSPLAVVTNNDVRLVIHPTQRDYETDVYLISLGYSDVSDEGSDPDGDTLPSDTLLAHGNFDTTLSTSDGVVWDAGIADQDLPDSLYRTSKPSFLGNLDWPVVDPETAKAKWQSGETNLALNAALYRFENNFEDPPAEGGGETGGGTGGGGVVGVTELRIGTIQVAP